MTRPKLPSQADVGQLAGVSRATVSQVLNNKTGFSVPAETRQRVLSAARELGYVPNLSARSLRTRKTYTVAAVIQDINNPFYPAFVRGVQDVAEKAGYDVISYNTDSTEQRERHFLDVLQRGRVDGVVGVFWHLRQAELRALTGRGIPLAVLGTFPGLGTELIDQVHVDDRQASRRAVEYLLAAGHRRVAVVTGPQTALDDRVQGAADALRAAGLTGQPDLIRGRTFGEACGYAAGLSLLARPEWPDAVFATNDLMALGVLRACRERGVHLPAQMALVGFDDIPAARLVTPALTTVNQFQERLGQRCAELLLDRLDGRYTEAAGRRVAMPFDLVIRDSA